MNTLVNVPITKVDEERRLVFGRAADETPDKSGEVMDYASSRPNFEAWSREIHEASRGKSFGNIRAMHGKTAAGVLAQPIHFDDEGKALDVVVKVVDDQEWKKVLDGVYTGFSIGGSYARRWQDGPHTRYTAQPTEISLVDNPCIPSARFFDLVKADGGIEQRAFRLPQVGDRVSFDSDRQTDKGPSDGEVVEIDGDRVKVRHADGEEWFDWPALHGELRDGRTWLMKASLPQADNLAGASVQHEDRSSAAAGGEVALPDLAADAALREVARADEENRDALRHAMVDKDPAGVLRRMIEAAGHRVDDAELREITKFIDAPITKAEDIDRDKVAAVMGEFNAGRLRSSSGDTVSDRKQALAIALSEGQKAAKFVIKETLWGDMVKQTVRGPRLPLTFDELHKQERRDAGDEPDAASDAPSDFHAALADELAAAGDDMNKLGGFLRDLAGVAAGGTFALTLLANQIDDEDEGGVAAIDRREPINLNRLGLGKGVLFDDLMKADQWDESKHPRRNDGRFAPKGSGSRTGGGGARAKTDAGSRAQASGSTSGGKARAKTGASASTGQRAGASAGRRGLRGAPRGFSESVKHGLRREWRGVRRNASKQLRQLSRDLARNPSRVLRRTGKGAAKHWRLVLGTMGAIKITKDIWDGLASKDYEFDIDPSFGADGKIGAALVIRDKRSGQTVASSRGAQEIPADLRAVLGEADVKYRSPRERRDGGSFSGGQASASPSRQPAADPRVNNRRNAGGIRFLDGWRPSSEYSGLSRDIEGYRTEMKEAKDPEIRDEARESLALIQRSIASEGNDLNDEDKSRLLWHARFGGGNRPPHDAEKALRVVEDNLKSNLTGDAYKDRKIYEADLAFASFAPNIRPHQRDALKSRIEARRRRVTNPNIENEVRRESERGDRRQGGGQPRPVADRQPTPPQGGSRTQQMLRESKPVGRREVEAQFAGSQEHPGLTDAGSGEFLDMPDDFFDDDGEVREPTLEELRAMEARGRFLDDDFELSAPTTMRKMLFADFMADRRPVDVLALAKAHPPAADESRQDYVARILAMGL